MFKHNKKSEGVALVVVVIILTLGLSLISIIYFSGIHQVKFGLSYIKLQSVVNAANAGIKWGENWLYTTVSADLLPPVPQNKTPTQQQLTPPFNPLVAVSQLNPANIGFTTFQTDNITVTVRVYALDYTPQGQISYKSGLPQQQHPISVTLSGFSDSMWGTYVGTGSSSSSFKIYYYLIRSKAETQDGTKKTVEKLIQIKIQD